MFHKKDLGTAEQSPSQGHGSLHCLVSCPMVQFLGGCAPHTRMSFSVNKMADENDRLPKTLMISALDQQNECNVFIVVTYVFEFYTTESGITSLVQSHPNEYWCPQKYIIVIFCIYNSI